MGSAKRRTQVSAPLPEAGGAVTNTCRQGYLCFRPYTKLTSFVEGASQHGCRTQQQDIPLGGRVTAVYDLAGRRASGSRGKREVGQGGWFGHDVGQGGGWGP